MNQICASLSMLLSQLVSMLIREPARQLVGQSAIQLVGESVGQLLIQLISWSTDRSVSRRSISP